jgi:hypothetical protein
VSVVFFPVDGQLKDLRYAERSSKAQACTMRRKINNSTRELLAGGTKLNNPTLIYRCAEFPSAIEHLALNLDERGSYLKRTIKKWDYKRLWALILDEKTDVCGGSRLLYI